ncbi:hypothetical protein K1719_005442 [Acacia pycnantha]|nr:hypothetical protein K1719_005442 [Acacia pycnantha]
MPVSFQSSWVVLVLVQIKVVACFPTRERSRNLEKGTCRRLPSEEIHEKKICGDDEPYLKGCNSFDKRSIELPSTKVENAKHSSDPEGVMKQQYSVHRYDVHGFDKSVNAAWIKPAQNDKFALSKDSFIHDPYKTSVVLNNPFTSGIMALLMGIITNDPNHE